MSRDDMEWEWFENLDNDVLIDRLESRGYMIIETHAEHVRVAENLKKKFDAEVAKGVEGEKKAEWYHTIMMVNGKAYEDDTQTMIGELMNRGVVALEEYEVDKLKCALDDIQCVLGCKS